VLIGVISDAHGHGRAFSDGLDLLKRQGADATYFLGDALGYFPSPSAVRILFNERSRVKCVKGNHEEMLLLGGEGKDKESIYKLDEVRPLLSDEEIEYLQSWPTSLEETIDEQLILFVHGTKENPTFGYLYPDGNVEALDGKYRVIFQGNTHWPMCRKVGDTLIVNPGSCSMPRDNGSFGSVATYDTETRKVRILRFSIKVANEELLKEFPETAPEVIALFSRDRSDFVGELIK
jgi:putative phosphoesterase